MANGKKREGFVRMQGEPSAHIDYYELLGLFAEGDELVANAAFEGLELSHDAANGATFDTVIFRNCSFDHVDFRDSTFRDVRFKSCRFISCAMDKAWLNRVDFIGCSAPGLSLMQARLAGVYARDTDFSYTNLSETSIDRLACHGSRLREAALQRAKLKNVSFEDCDLMRLDVFGTPLKGVDFSSCIFQVPVLSQDFHELRGAIVAPEQAVDLVRLLGVEIAGE